MIKDTTKTMHPHPTIAIITLIVVLIASVSCMNPSISRDQDKPSHHGHNRFRNPYIHRDINFLQVLKMRFFDEEWIDWKGHEHKVPFQYADLDIITNKTILHKITWIGHSSFLIQIGNITILTDPVFYDVASPVSFAGPERIHPPALSQDQLPAIDYVLVSHNHYDHLDKHFVRWFNNRAFWIVPLGVKRLLVRYGVSPENIAELDWYNQYEGPDVTITATPAQHCSGRTPWDRNMTLWATFAVQFSDFSFWFGADTGYNDIQFREIGERFDGFDLAIIPIGAYQPRWFMQPVHVNPEEAVWVHKDVRSRLSIASHWGTFRLSAERVDEPLIELEKAIANQNLADGEFITMGIGETRVLR